MDNNNLTDAEIKKALEICASEHLGCEDGCPLKEMNCRFEMPKLALDLINRQEEDKDVMQYCIDHLQKESEKLNNEKEAIIKYHPSTTHPYEVITPYGVFFAKTEKEYDDFKKNIKAEAYKECLKKFEKNIKDVKVTLGQTWEIQNALKKTLNELVGDSQ